MTDREKLKAIRTEIHRLVDVCGYPREMANALFVFMDSLPNESVSEDLEKVSFDNAQKNYKEGFRGTAMQAFNEGANWQKQKMMAKAVDVEVKVDAGGYPYIPQMELYDYEKDIPLAKEGDKYKVILIKEG